MFKRIKNSITATTVAGFLLVMGLMLGSAPALASAQTATNNISSICSGVNGDLSGGSGTCDQSSSTSLNNVIKFALNLISIFVGITAVIMIIIGGFKYIVSGGDSGRITGAKDTILFAIIGLVVVALAQIIVHFVLSSLAPHV
jgi:hypothetical protein